MVSAERDDAGEHLVRGLGAVLVKATRTRTPVKCLFVAGFNLTKSQGRVVGRRLDIAAVHYLGPRVEWVHTDRHIIAAQQTETTRALADSRRSKTSAGTVRCCRVEWRSQDPDVERLV